MYQNSRFIGILLVEVNTSTSDKELKEDDSLFWIISASSGIHLN